MAILKTRIADGDLVDFNTATVDGTTVRFGPAGAVPTRARRAEVDGDGDRDLVFSFHQNDTGFVCGDVIGTLTGKTVTGRSFTGSDSVTIVPCP